MTCFSPFLWFSFVFPCSPLFSRKDKTWQVGSVFRRKSVTWEKLRIVIHDTMNGKSQKSVNHCYKCKLRELWPKGGYHSWIANFHENFCATSAATLSSAADGPALPFTSEALPWTYLSLKRGIWQDTLVGFRGSCTDPGFQTPSARSSFLEAKIKQIHRT